MDDQQLAEAKKQIELEIQERQRLLESYQIVENDLLRRSKPTSEPQHNGDEEKPIHNLIRRATEQLAYGHNSKIVKHAISNMHTPYSVREILHFLQAQGEEITKDEISTVLSRFQRAEKIEVHQPGAGRRPTYYKATQNGALL